MKKETFSIQVQEPPPPPPEPEHGHRTGPGAGSYRGAVGGPGNGKMGGEWGVGVDTYDTYTRSKNWIGILEVYICHYLYTKCFCYFDEIFDPEKET